MIITINSFSPLNVLSELFTSSITAFGLMTNPTKIQVKNARIGISTLLLIKSKVSKIEKLRNVISLQTPNPKEEGIPIINAIAVTTRQVNLRLQWNLSLKIETIVSISEMEDVNAAKNTKIKNSVPIAPPIGMLLNTFGSIINISPGP